MLRFIGTQCPAIRLKNKCYPVFWVDVKNNTKPIEQNTVVQINGRKYTYLDCVVDKGPNSYYFFIVEELCSE